MECSKFITCISLLAWFFTVIDAQSCEPGSFYFDKNCVECPPGKYQDQSGASSCKLCPAGTFNKFSGAQGQDLCRRCPTETISSKGSMMCKPCPVNSGPNAFNSKCITCGKGTYLFGGVCQKCQVGAYGPLRHNLECISCPPGFSTRREGATSLRECARCPPGSGAGGSFCTKCVEGNYAAPGSNCKACPTGFFSDTIGATSCTPCPIGKYQPLSGEFRCIDCESGRVALTRGTSFCTIPGASCPSNYFKDELGACRRCEPGFRLNPLLKKCVACRPKEISFGGSTTKCLPCPEGKVFQPSPIGCSCKAGSVSQPDGSCKLCDKGTFRESANSGATCQKCPVGTYSDKFGAIKCTNCPNGFIAAEEGQTRCTKCPEGTMPDPDSFEARCVSVKSNCPLGSRRDTSNGVTCIPNSCPEGTYVTKDGQGKKTCKKCFAGTRFLPQNNTCERCGDQEISSGGVQRFCTKCPNNLFRYRPKGDSCECISTTSGVGFVNGTCKPCPRGTQIRYYEIKCSPCPPGKFGNTVGQYFGCQNCPPGAFNNISGATSCKKCPNGTTSYGIGETSCVSIKR